MLLSIWILCHLSYVGFVFSPVSPCAQFQSLHYLYMFMFQTLQAPGPRTLVTCSPRISRTLGSEQWCLHNLNLGACISSPDIAFYPALYWLRFTISYTLSLSQHEPKDSDYTELHLPVCQHITSCLINTYWLDRSWNVKQKIAWKYERHSKSPWKKLQLCQTFFLK